jgi:ATP-dependent Clp protease protease subunit
MSHTIYVYDEIGAWGVTAESIAAQLDGIRGGDILVRINSPGGDVFDGLAIYNLLRGRSEKITPQVDGWAASAASVVAMAGDSISMASNAFMLIHAPWTIHGGTAEDFRKMAAQLTAIEDSLVDTYSVRRNLPRSRVAAWVAAETMWNASEAASVGMADRVVEESAVAASASGLPQPEHPVAASGTERRSRCPEHPAIAARRAEKKRAAAIFQQQRARIQTLSRESTERKLAIERERVAANSRSLQDQITQVRHRG